MLYVTLKSVIMLTFFQLSVVIMLKVFMYHLSAIFEKIFLISSLIWVCTKYYKPKMDPAFLFSGLLKVKGRSNKAEFAISKLFVRIIYYQLAHHIFHSQIPVG
jgi:hypothetical protein